MTKIKHGCNVSCGFGRKHSAVGNMLNQRHKEDAARVRIIWSRVG